MDREITILMFLPDMPYRELRNMVRSFFPYLVLYLRKFTKTKVSVGSRKMAEISAPSRGK